MIEIFNLIIIFLTVQILNWNVYFNYCIFTAKMLYWNVYFNYCILTVQMLDWNVYFLRDDLEGCGIGVGCMGGHGMEW